LINIVGVTGHGYPRACLHQISDAAVKKNGARATGYFLMSSSNFQKVK